MEQLQECIDRAKRIVFFGGAGVSTESGIPDFRSSDGIFAQQEEEGLTPEMILSASFFYLHPERFYSFYRKRMLFPDARPNAAHRKLFELEKKGKLRGIITQNIDGLHRIAGNRLVYELHGSVHENYCMDCGRQYDLPFILNTEGIPRCPSCGGIVKPYVVLYGEAPDMYTMIGAKREISNCDLLIVAGTSLQVEPAAGMLDLYRGKELVIINREECPADDRATLILRSDVADCFGRLTI